MRFDDATTLALYRGMVRQTYGWNPLYCRCGIDLYTNPDVNWQLLSSGTSIALTCNCPSPDTRTVSVLQLGADWYREHAPPEWGV
jgi:hypothetical protein